MRDKITQEEYDEIMSMSPQDRVRESSDTIDNKIVGILIGYSKIYDMRNGWIDILTTGDARDEIKQLILDCGGKI